MLKVTEIRKTFFAGTPNEVRALQGVSLTLERGSLTGRTSRVGRSIAEPN
jgi:ABC-type uncharacterized transport system ATPase component